MKWKDELNIQFRILEVLQLLELEDYDWIDFKLETLRKFVSRNRKLKNPRIDGIIKVLYALQAKSYDLTRLNKSTLELIKKLNSSEKGWEWNPLGFELVRFDAWLERKMG
jgi:alpha-D-ribose 1-methylphosphonate 5-triphosphate synthase subunit PhnL